MKRKRARRLGNIECEMLERLSLGDLTYGFLLSARSSRRMMRLARQRARYRYRRKKALERLAAIGFVRRRGEKLSLTESGKVVLAGAIARTAKLIGSQWDGKWRIVTFDIPEKYAALRNKVRSVLKRAGFVKLHLSVWIFPYECEELVRLVKEESRLARYILYGTLERLENDGPLKEHFKI